MLDNIIKYSDKHLVLDIFGLKLKFRVDFFPNKNVLKNIKKQIVSGKKNYLYIDWPFGGYIFEEMLKANYQNINLIKLSLMDLFSVDNKQQLNRITKHYPKKMFDFYVKSFKKINIDGLLLTHDWPKTFQVIIKAFNKLQIKTICIVHEGVFQNEDIFYDSQKPISDLVLCWGELHKNIFIKRGYSKDAIIPVGSIKLNSYKHFSPKISKEDMFSKLNIDVNKKTILYCCQLCDNQWGNQDFALLKQREVIMDLVKISQNNNYNLIIRNAPANPSLILPKEFIKKLENFSNVCVDGFDLTESQKSTYITNSSDNLFYSNIIVGMNTTMQLEASILNKPSIVVAYFDFDPKWHTELGLPICKNFAELEVVINNSIDIKHNLINQDKKEMFYKNYGFNDNLNFCPLETIEEILK